MPSEERRKPGDKAGAVPVVTCEWCHWEFPLTQMTLTAGRRLCIGCAGMYHADDEDEIE